jgi:calcium-binding acidic-repeat protein
MKFFQKDLRKEYLKMTGIKYGKEEEKEIKSMLKSEMPLEIFKLCVTPMIDERKLKEIGNSHIELKKIAETNTLIYLKAGQMKELKKGYEDGLKYEEIELYKKADLTSRDMQKARENIQEIKKESEEELSYYDIESVLKYHDTKKEKKILQETKEEDLKTKDSDGDGLTDFEEIYIYNTDKERKDTDGDGKSDQEEVKIEKSNPRDTEKEIENNNGLKEYKEKKKKKEKEFER